MRIPPRRPAPPAPTDYTIVLEALEGIEGLAAEEVDERLRPPGPIELPRPGELRFSWRGELRQLLELRGATAAYLALPFDVPRPRALLGHQHLTALAAGARSAIALHPGGSFETLRLSAAGEESAVLARLKGELSAALGLRLAEEEGDLLIRLRRAGAGWEALVRLSPRPLSARAWRVRNFPGAANAALARALALLAAPRPDDSVLNICCGSGTLLIERLLAAPARRALGCDLDPLALECAAANLGAAGLAGRARLERWDATDLPIESASVDMILGDLPFGQLVGSHAENARLYPRVLGEAARVARPGARMALLSHELRLLERAAELHRDRWALRQVVRVRSGGIMPGIFLLERVGA